IIENGKLEFRGFEFNKIFVSARKAWGNGGKYENNIDKLLFSNYFEELVDIEELSRFKTDNYGDAGNDYIFFSLNRNLLFEFEDIDDIDLSNDKNVLEIYCIQIKNSQKLDSNVPNKFIEFSRNLITGNTPTHYNEEVNENIEFFQKLLEELLLKVEVQIHFYYFSRVSKKQIQDASDLLGRFETLKSTFSTIDYIKKCNYNIIGINDIIESIKKETKFEYTFKNIDKFEAEIKEIEDESETSSIIALVPIKQYFDFINGNDNKINDKLFDSNIRDYKGRSNVNKDIIKTLGENDDLDFWWLNNGITITAEKIEESVAGKRIKISNPQIVNGLQTSYSIYHYYSQYYDILENEKRKLFVKILRINDEEQELRVIVATNSQNEIRDKDIHANDQVQKNIESYFKSFGKYYQRKDKYYTNRQRKKKDIVKLADMAKFINTIYLKDPSFTRNNPGKLLNGVKYESIFKIKEIDQDYERYKIAYQVYDSVSSFNKGVLKIGDDEFERSNFLHHVVYCTICIMFNNIDYTPIDLKSIKVNEIDELLVNKASDVIINTIIDNSIPHAKILKSIKEQKFKQQLNIYMNNNLFN
ncbi:MAG: AIPR family protein, partial [Coprobacillus cateniformis]|nr:AIPR family protein [Coprobacillus cateniformis]